MTDRRYNEAEVAAIFERAAEAVAFRLRAWARLRLRQMQAVAAPAALTAG